MGHLRANLKNIKDSGGPEGALGDYLGSSWRYVWLGSVAEVCMLGFLCASACVCVCVCMSLHVFRFV